MAKLALTALLMGVAEAQNGQLVFPVKSIGVDVKGKSVDMPMVGVGTWLYNNSQTEQEVTAALKMGARLIDTANMYGNEDGVRKAIKDAGIAVDKLFISTKVPGGLGTNGTIEAHEKNLQSLGVDSVDLLLVHFPCAFPKTPTGPPLNCTKQARQDTWRGLETLWRSGKARAIGVSHYCQSHLKDVLEINTVPIAVNQQEWHVGMGVDPEGVVSFCKKHGIHYQSFSPLCGPCPDASHKELIEGKLTTAIGKKHNMTGAQVALRWLIQQGSPVVPKSSNPKHLRENLDLFQPGFELSDAEMVQLTDAKNPPSAEPVSGDCSLGEESPVIFA